MEELENDTNESMLIVSSDLMNPTMQFEGKFLGLLVTYIVGRVDFKNSTRSRLGQAREFISLMIKTTPILLSD